MYSFSVLNSSVQFMVKTFTASVYRKYKKTFFLFVFQICQLQQIEDIMKRKIKQNFRKLQD